MKGKELIELIESNGLQEWDIVFTQTVEVDNGYGIQFNNFDVESLNDLGHSDKVALFDLIERN